MKILCGMLTVTALGLVALAGSSVAPHGSQANAAGACNTLTFHDERREGGVCCFPEHSHSGVGAGETSRVKAVATAIKAWEDFTWFEYGSPYGRWSLAHSKEIKCESTNGWTCSAVARPCHRG